MKKILFSILLFTSLLFPQEFDYLPRVKDGIIIKHQYYTLSFIDKYKQPEWVAYKLTPEMIVSESERSNKFKPDPLVDAGTAVDADYRHSNYDKGHLCPAADMSWLQEAMDETFYFSNISPQLPGFNRGIWKKLEEQVRDWARKEKKLYIVAGGVLNDSLKTIGQENEVSVPVWFYKVVLDYEKPEQKGIGFIFTNESSSSPLSDYAVTIDSVESFTKLDFFPAIPDKLERKIESKLDKAAWRLTETGVEEAVDPVAVQCSAITKQGARCKRIALPGSKFCKQHSGK